MTPAELALMTARTVVAQLEAMVGEEQATEGITLACPDCKTTNVQQLEKAPDEDWRIHCVVCDKVWVERTITSGVQ